MGGKRKDKSAPGDPSVAGSEQPPAKKPRKTPVSKKDKGGAKADTDLATTGGQVASAATSSAQAGGSEEVDDNGLEKVSLDELMPKGATGVQSFASELVVSEGDVRSEAKKTTDTMRRAFKEGDLTMPSVLSRTKGRLDEFSMVFGAPEEEEEGGDEGAPTVMDKALLHEAKAQALCQQVLTPRGMNYTKEAVASLSDGIQSHFRTLIESAIAAFHKRTNRKAIEHYNQMEELLSSRITISSPSGSAPTTLQPGEVKPDNVGCYAMLFGQDEAKRASTESSELRERLRAQIAEVDDRIREYLQQADEALKKGSKRSAKFADKDKGGSTSAVEDSVPWWKKEVNKYSF